MKEVRLVSKHFNNIIEDIYSTRTSFRIDVGIPIERISYLKSYLYEIKIISITNSSNILKNVVQHHIDNNRIQSIHAFQCEIDEDTLWELFKKMPFLKELTFSLIPNQINYSKLFHIASTSLKSLSIQFINMDYTYQRLRGYEIYDCDNDVTLESLSLKFTNVTSFLQLPSVEKTFQKIGNTLKSLTIDFNHFLEDEIMIFRSIRLKNLENLLISVHQIVDANLVSTVENVALFLNIISGREKGSNGVFNVDYMFRNLRKLKFQLAQEKVYSDSIWTLNFTQLYFLQVSI